MHQRYSRFIHWISAIVGTLIAGPPLNSVICWRSAEGRDSYMKRRHWYAAALIASAKYTRARFQVLPKTEWHVWEQAVYWQVYGETVYRTADGALVLPARPGRNLRELLSSADDQHCGLAGVAAALRSLAELHQQVIALPDRQSRLFSHGDATIANATYEPDIQRAWWFDFETSHNPQYTHSWRCADDLRALLFSAVAAVGASAIDPLARLVTIEYARPYVLHELRAMAVLLLHHPDPWHLAQARLSYELNQAMAQALLLELEK